MKKALSFLLTTVIVFVLCFSFVFLYSYFNETDSTSYPDRTSVESAVIGPANRVTISDFIIWNWADNPDKGVSATMLPKEIVTDEVDKCSKAETILVCMLENRYNAKICLRKTDYSKENMRFCTHVAKYIELFNKNYLLLECSDDSKHDPIALTYVLYEFDDDVSALFGEFETTKENYFKTFPSALKELSLDGGKMFFLIVLFLVIFILLFLVNEKLFGKIMVRTKHNRTKTIRGRFYD